jgi:hypothetical protein
LTVASLIVPRFAQSLRDHSFNLAIRPGVLHLGQPVLDLMFAADAVKDVLEGRDMPFVIGELNTIIGEHNVDPVGHGGDQVAQKRCCGHFPGFRVQLDVGEFGGAIDGDEEIQLAFSRLNFSNINVEVEQFQRKWKPVSRPELRQNKELYQLSLIRTPKSNGAVLLS